MINENHVFIAGKVTKFNKSPANKRARVYIEVPAGPADSERDENGKKIVAVDIVKDLYEKSEIIKEGDYVSLMASIVQVKMDVDGEEGKRYSIAWLRAIPSHSLIVIPDAGKYVEGSGYNHASITGKVFRLGELFEYKEGKWMVKVTIQYMPKLPKSVSDDDRKAATCYIDAAFFGATAEKYVSQFVKEGDVMHIEGPVELTPVKWKSKGKVVSSLRIRPDEINFITPVAKSGGKVKNDTPDAKENDSFLDDDLPF